MSGLTPDITRAAESAVLGAGPAELTMRRLEGARDSHTYERRRLYDHLQRLQDLTRAGGWALGFEGVGAAAAHLDPPGPGVSIGPPPSSTTRSACSCPRQVPFRGLLVKLAKLANLAGILLP